MAQRSALLLLLLAAACGGAPGPALTSLDGAVVHPLQRAPGAVHVVVFLSQECPIANAYAPVLRELAQAWRDQPVRLFLTHVDPDLTQAAAAQHAKEYELPGTVLLDPRHELASALGATRTPEAFVLADAGTVYRGRIDDQWAALGARAAAASIHDLRDAVAATLAGQPIATPITDSIGCLLPEPRR